MNEQVRKRVELQAARFRFLVAQLDVWVLDPQVDLDDIDYLLEKLLTVHQQTASYIVDVKAELIARR